MSRRDRAAARMTLEELRRIRPELAAEIEREGVTDPPAKAGKPGAAWSAAKPTAVDWQGELVTLPSKTEARVARRLLEEVAAAPGTRIYRQVRVPLLTIAPGRRGVPLYLTVDFVVVEPDGTEHWIDAKTKRRSREWVRGRAAAEAWLGERVAEVDR